MPFLPRPPSHPSRNSNHYTRASPKEIEGLARTFIMRFCITPIAIQCFACFSSGFQLSSAGDRPQRWPRALHQSRGRAGCNWLLLACCFALVCRVNDDNFSLFSLFTADKVHFDWVNHNHTNWRARSLRTPMELGSTCNHHHMF
jgi:membrane associated rhomboid family serine protease